MLYFAAILMVIHFESFLDQEMNAVL